MARQVAFLRAVNVGGRTVKMAELRKILSELDVSGVETFIASGNVVFDWEGQDGPALEAAIEDRLAGALGYPVETFVRTCAELVRVAALRPFGPEDALEGRRPNVVFLRTPPTDELRKRILSLAGEEDRFYVEGREIHWHGVGGVGRSPVAGALGKAVGRKGTMRNVNTVRRIVEKYCRQGL